MMNWTFGDVVPGLAIDGRPAQAAVFNEHEVRAAAGLTLVPGAIAFVYAYFAKLYLPIQLVTALFFVEFGVRVTLGIRRSPVGVIARWRRATRCWSRCSSTTATICRGGRGRGSNTSRSMHWAGSTKTTSAGCWRCTPAVCGWSP